MRKHRFGARLALLFGAIATTSILVGAAPALAVTETHTITAVVGPVFVPLVPVTVCLDTTCVFTPPATVVAVGLSLTESITAVPPTITNIGCPAGETGAAVVIATGADSVTVGGTIFAVVGTIVDFIPVGPVVVPVNHTITVSACTT